MLYSAVPLCLFTCALLIASLAGTQLAAQQSAANARRTAPVTNLPSFEVATIRPSKPGRFGEDLDESNNRLTIQNYSLRHLIREAYSLKADSQIIGGPAWLDTQRFDIVAKVDDAEVARMDKMEGGESDREWDLYAAVAPQPIAFSSKSRAVSARCPSSRWSSRVPVPK